MKLRTLTIVALMSSLFAACSSEVDKCVDAYMKAADDFWKREGISGDELQARRLNELAVKRRVCLEAAGRK